MRSPGPVAEKMDSSEAGFLLEGWWWWCGFLRTKGFNFRGFILQRSESEAMLSCGQMWSQVQKLLESPEAISGAAQTPLGHKAHGEAAGGGVAHCCLSLVAVSALEPWCSA